MPRNANWTILLRYSFQTIHTTSPSFLLLTSTFYLNRKFIIIIMRMILKRKIMDFCRFQLAVAALLLIVVFPKIQAWGEDGHAITCKIAQVRSCLFCLYAFYISECVSLFGFDDSLGWARRQRRQWEICCQNQQEMTWQVYVRGRIMSSLYIHGRLLCTTLTLLTPFAITSTTVSQSSCFYSPWPHNRQSYP